MAWAKGNRLNFKHGLIHHPLYRVWGSMKARCYYAKCQQYNRYGGRGIRFCREWLEFKPFYDWAIASGYHHGLYIDRIDNDGDYEPANCRFVTPVESGQHRSDCKLDRDSALEICEMLRCGVPKKTIERGYNISTGTLSDLLRDKTWKFLGEKPNQDEKIKATMTDAERIRQLSSQGRTGVSIAHEFGISSATTSRVINRKERYA